MNKKVIEGLKEYDLEYINNNAYGFIKDFEVNFYNVGAQVMIFVSTFLSHAQKNVFYNELASYKFKGVKFQDWEYGVFVVLTYAWSIGEFPKKGPEVVKAIFDVLEKIEAPKKEICPVTGLELNIENSDLATCGPGLKVTISKDGIESINESIEKNEEDFKSAPNNYFKGFIGILIGTVAGIVCTLVISLLGYISAISAVLSIWLGTLLYKKLGGKPNVVMIIMAVVMTLIAQIGYTYVRYYGIALSCAEVDGIQDMNGILGFYLENWPEFKDAFSSDLGSTILFTLIGTVLSVIDSVKTIRRPKKIE